MINPSLRVQQVQLPDQFINVNFMKIPKVDRCTTCHIAADRKGFEDPKIKTVFRTHPRIHRMVGSESMHPATTFGCTPCHGGRDRATSFWSAGHSPQTEAQERAWTKKYDWEFDKFNENPVLPLKYAEAGCYRCHTREVNFPDAPTLDAGHADRRDPRLLGLPPHRRPREAAPAEGRAVAREGRLQGLDASGRRAG